MGELLNEVHHFIRHFSRECLVALGNCPEDGRVNSPHTHNVGHELSIRVPKPSRYSMKSAEGSGGIRITGARQQHHVELMIKLHESAIVSAIGCYSLKRRG